jgi:hypothetical protein
MNAIRPHSGEPMEAYSFQYGATVDFAINTLISAQTSMIGAPLGMGTVFAGKIARALDLGMSNNDRDNKLAELTRLGEDLMILEQQSINILQLITSIKQYLNAYEFDAFRKLSPKDVRKHIPDLANISDQNVLAIRNILVYSFDFSELTMEFYSNSFQDLSGPNSEIADLGRLQVEQQKILERSFEGISGYPSYLEGLNGGFTIAAGVLIENAEGGLGDDHIIGNAENNTLLGLDGNDAIEGYLGADTLTGGRGSDVFVYSKSGDSPDLGRDTITDFRPAEDLISLKPLRTNLSNEASALNAFLNNDFAFQFVGSAAYSRRAGEVRFSATSLEIDLNGDSVTDMAINLPGVTSFFAANLIL